MGHSILHDREFAAVQDILKKKQKELKGRGKGNKPNAAEPLTDDDIGKFYARKVLGNHAPSPSAFKYTLAKQLYFLRNATR